MDFQPAQGNGWDPEVSGGQEVLGPFVGGQCQPGADAGVFRTVSSAGHYVVGKVMPSLV